MIIFKLFSLSCLVAYTYSAATCTGKNESGLVEDEKAVPECEPVKEDEKRFERRQTSTSPLAETMYASPAFPHSLVFVGSIGSKPAQSLYFTFTLRDKPLTIPVSRFKATTCPAHKKRNVVNFDNATNIGTENTSQHHKRDNSCPATSPGQYDTKSSSSSVLSGRIRVTESSQCPATSGKRNLEARAGCPNGGGDLSMQWMSDVLTLGAFVYSAFQFLVYVPPTQPVAPGNLVAFYDLPVPATLAPNAQVSSAPVVPPPPPPVPAPGPPFPPNPQDFDPTTLEGYGTSEFSYDYYFPVPTTLAEFHQYPADMNVCYRWKSTYYRLLWEAAGQTGPVPTSIMVIVRAINAAGLRHLLDPPDSSSGDAGASGSGSRRKRNNENACTQSSYIAFDTVVKTDDYVGSLHSLKLATDIASKPYWRLSLQSVQLGIGTSSKLAQISVNPTPTPSVSLGIIELDTTRSIILLSADRVKNIYSGIAASQVRPPSAKNHYWTYYCRSPPTVTFEFIDSTNKNLFLTMNERDFTLGPSPDALGWCVGAIQEVKGPQAQQFIGLSFFRSFFAMLTYDDSGFPTSATFAVNKRCMDS